MPFLYTGSLLLERFCGLPGLGNMFVEAMGEADYPVIRHWAGLRPGTARGIPYIGEHDEIGGLYIHAGHYRNGIVLGAASAELLAELVTGGVPFCDPAPYAMGAEH